MEGFVRALLKSSASAGSLVAEGEQPIDAAGNLTVVVGGQRRTLPLPVLFGQFSKCATETNRARFVDRCVNAYVRLAPTLEAAGPALRPLLVSAAWYAERSKAMPAFLTIPSCDFIDGARRSGAPLRFVAVMDTGKLILPVTSFELSVWGGATFADALVVAARRLKQLNGGTQQGKGKDKDKWSRHPTGCATSGWRDGYDATRAALLPQVITDAVSTSESTGADFAAVFATANCVMFAATRNPLGLCFMGDLTLDVSEKHKSELMRAAPYRLHKAKAKALTKKVPAATQSKTKAKAKVGVLTCRAVLLEMRGGLRWTPYLPRAGVEFGVPAARSECEKILEHIQSASKGPIPVFPRADFVPAPKEEKAAAVKPLKRSTTAKGAGAEAEAERQAGNDCYKRKEFEKALLHYDAAINLVSISDVRPLANRSSALLKLKRFEAAFSCCTLVLLRDPSHLKSLYRRGTARAELGDWHGAASDFGAFIAQNKPNAAATRSATKLLKTATEQRDAAAAYVLEVSKRMNAPPSPQGQGKGLAAWNQSIADCLETAVGWTATPKGGGTLPGWIPSVRRCTATTERRAARLAAVKLYSMVRDASTTKRDSATGSGYLACAAKGKTKTQAMPSKAARVAAFKAIATHSGERSLVLLALANGAAMDPQTAFSAPLEERTLGQLLGSVMAVGELRKISRHFGAVMSKEPAFVELLKSPDLRFEGAAATPGGGGATVTAALLVQATAEYESTRPTDTPTKETTDTGATKDAPLSSDGDTKSSEGEGMMTLDQATLDAFKLSSLVGSLPAMAGPSGLLFSPSSALNGLGSGMFDLPPSSNPFDGMV